MLIPSLSSSAERNCFGSIASSRMTQPSGKSCISPSHQYDPVILSIDSSASCPSLSRMRYSPRFAFRQYGRGFHWSVPSSKKCIGTREIPFTSAIVFSVRVTIRRAVNGHGPFTTAIFVTGNRSRSSWVISGNDSNSFP